MVLVLSSSRLFCRRPWRPAQTRPPIVTHWVEANLVKFWGRLVKTQDLLGPDQEMTRDTLFKMGFELWSPPPLLVSSLPFSLFDPNKNLWNVDGSSFGS